MTTPQTMSGGGDAVPAHADPAAEVKTALAGLMQDISHKFTKQEEKLTMLEAKTQAPLRRPALAVSAELEAPHQKAFEAYVRGGDEGAMREVALEGKAMSSTSDGGFVASPQISEAIEVALSGGNSLRKVANVVQIEGGSYEVLTEAGGFEGGWLSEGGSAAETGTPSTSKTTIPLAELAANPKITQRLLDDAAFNIEEWLAERIADSFARAEASAFINGTGSGQPLGILAAPSMDDVLASATTVGVIKTGNAGDFDANTPSDNIVDLVYALGARYRENATFVMNSRTAGAIRKLKDADGRFLWSDTLAAGEPARLMGYPVLICEDMPDIADGAHAIAFGDFQRAYTIAERPDLRVLRDPFSAKPNVLFYATKRVGGGVVDPKAYKLLSFAA